MQFFVLTEGHHDSHQRFVARWNRRVYKGLGVTGGDAMVKLGYPVLYSMRVNRNARSAVLKDLVQEGVLSLDALPMKSPGGFRTSRFFGWLGWFLKCFGFRLVSLKDFDRSGCRNPECMWKVLVAEMPDGFENGEEVI